ncbi:MAG: hypothetical protein GF331_05695 [Chitinivibrionales bacterium]|nr:hypothetical protein [Chitinivibrionales bacterium]
MPSGALYEVAADQVVELFAKAGARPKTVVLRECTFADVVEPILTSAGVRCTYQDNLPRANKLLEELDERSDELEPG